ncbi:SMI1/KNR4 family protein [Streptomyces botrytidirepellens]|uniref:SMI1/KNR4 family protein n=1 Tax=Streptomyces botrytidirepellens TaxID=2486417 RepID=UPI001615C4E9|nr:SMI1/KNR4 family protein [Streptomyces botrytidirepellens]
MTGHPPSTQDIETRQVTDAWTRIETWIAHHAPHTQGLLLTGASPDAVTGLQRQTGVRIPSSLKALWARCAGTRSARHSTFLMGGHALMRLETVAAKYSQEMSHQRLHTDDTVTWRAAWIPVFSFSADDQTSGLYMDTETGRLCRWTRYAQHHPEPEYESLTDYLEEMADSLETPDLATSDKPGLVAGALVWGSMINPDDEHLWTPLTA